MPTAPYQRYLTMPAEVKAVGDGSVRRVVGTGTTSSLDRHGEHVHPDAVAKSMDAYMRNPVMGYAHDTLWPIGKWTQWRRVEGGIELEGEVLSPGDEIADRAWKRIEEGVVKGLSVGFNPVGSWRQSGEEDDDGNFWWGGKSGDRPIEVIEWSIVPIPANTDAQDLHVAKSLGADASQPWREQDSRIVAGVCLGDLEDPEERRFFDDVDTALKRLTGVANITRHWAKEGRALSPETLDALVSPITSLVEIAKQGRVLSASNRTAVETAVQALQEVLARDSESEARRQGQPEETEGAFERAWYGR